MVPVLLISFAFTRRGIVPCCLDINILQLAAIAALTALFGATSSTTTASAQPAFRLRKPRGNRMRN